MSIQPERDVLPMEQGYNYAQLEPEVVQTVREATARIRERIKRNLAGVVAMGHRAIALSSRGILRRPLVSDN